MHENKNPKQYREANNITTLTNLPPRKPNLPITKSAVTQISVYKRTLTFTMVSSNPFDMSGFCSNAKPKALK